MFLEPYQESSHGDELLLDQFQALKNLKIHDVNRISWVDIHLLDYVVVGEHLNYQSFMAVRSNGDGDIRAIRYHLESVRARLGLVKVSLSVSPLPEVLTVSSRRTSGNGVAQ